MGRPACRFDGDEVQGRGQVSDIPKGQNGNPEGARDALSSRSLSSYSPICDNPYLAYLLIVSGCCPQTHVSVMRDNSYAEKIPDVLIFEATPFDGRHQERY